MNCSSNRGRIVSAPSRSTSAQAVSPPRWRKIGWVGVSGSAPWSGTGQQPARRGGRGAPLWRGPEKRPGGRGGGGVGGIERPETGEPVIVRLSGRVGDFIQLSLLTGDEIPTSPIPGERDLIATA